MKTFPALLMAAAISIHSSLANDFQVGITVKSPSDQTGTMTSLKKNNRDDIGRAAQNGVNNGLTQGGLETVSFDAAVRNLRTSRELQCNMMACNYYSCQTFRHNHPICLMFCSSCSWYRRLALADSTTAGTTIDHQQEALNLANKCADRIRHHMNNSKYNSKQRTEIKNLVCSVEVISKPDTNGASEKYVADVVVGGKVQQVLGEQLVVIDYKTLQVLSDTTLTTTSTTSLTTLDGPNV